MRRPGIPRSPWFRVTLVLPFFALSGLLIWWRGPDWGAVYHAFDFVEWRWIVVAVVLNLGSIVVRALAWQLVLGQALDPPLPRFRRTFSAFCVGLLGNAALPGRVGELARVAVLRRTAAARAPPCSGPSSLTASSTSCPWRFSSCTCSPPPRSRTGR